MALIEAKGVYVEKHISKFIIVTTPTPRRNGRPPWRTPLLFSQLCAYLLPPPLTPSFSSSAACAAASRAVSNRNGEHET